MPKTLPVLRDAALLFVATFFGGFLVGLSGISTNGQAAHLPLMSLGYHRAIATGEVCRIWAPEDTKQQGNPAGGRQHLPKSRNSDGTGLEAPEGLR